MPVTVPLAAAWNCTPSSTELVSAASVTPGGAESGQMVHGQLPVMYALLVVKEYVYGVIGWPKLSWAPLMLTVYVVPAASELVAVKVATVLVLSKDVVPGTVIPLGSFRVNDVVLGTTGLENVAEEASVTALLVEPA